MIKKITRRMIAIFTALLIIALGAGIAWSMQRGVSQLPLKRYFATSYTNAVWDWSNPANKSSTELRNITDFMYLHQLNTVYVNVGAYASVLAEKDGSTARTAQKNLEEGLVRYIRAMKEHHITVYAAAGDVMWSDPRQRHIPVSILDSVKKFNDNHPDTRFAGMEFDIESYNQPGFADGSVTVKTLVLSDLLETVDVLATKVSGYHKQGQPNFDLGFAIPYWLDNENGNIPAITWRGKVGPTLYHLMDRLNSLPSSNVVVMAYRNVASGNDGVIAHSRTEIDYARAKAANVNVLIGQEVNEVEPAKITYFDQTTTELATQIKAVQDEFGPTDALSGFAINDLTGYRAMSDE